MVDIRDCYNKLVCKYNAITGLVESLFNHHKTTVTLSVGQSIEFGSEYKNEYIVTTIVRISDEEFDVKSVVETTTSLLIV